MFQETELTLVTSGKIVNLVYLITPKIAVRRQNSEINEDFLTFKVSLDGVSILTFQSCMR